MTTATLPELTGRHQLFEAARGSADRTVNELWASYLAFGGQLLVVDLQGCHRQLGEGWRSFGVPARRTPLGEWPLEAAKG